MKFFFLSSSFFFPSDVTIAVDAVQLHLSADPQTKKYPQHRAFIRQRGLRFHSPPELQLHPLDGVGGAQRPPLAFRKPIERQQVFPRFLQRGRYAWTLLLPFQQERFAGLPSDFQGLRVHDAVILFAHRFVRVLRRFRQQVAQLVHRAALLRQPGPPPIQRRPSPALPSLITSRGRPIFRVVRSSSNNCQPSADSAPVVIRLSSTFSPFSRTPSATSTGSETTLPPLRTFG